MKPIKYTTTSAWLAPYVDSVSHLIPIERLSAIKGYKVLKNKEINQQGQIILDLTNKRFTITLRTEKYSKVDKVYRNEYIANVLETLAHELAHMVHWEHTPAHWKLQATIQTEFGTVLDRLNIEDTQVRFE
jgi:hypothetical protein